ncbi:MAG: phage integrase SAM-like domain-containing protein [Cyclobacteriaceae bacterium]|nr:phage integrase SAM-like domain-containing protein [Cyclobacteriaceae bacterium]
MATVKFILRKDKKNASGLAPVYAQYIHLEGKTLFATGKKVEPKFWDKNQGKVKRHEEALSINSFLKSFARKIEKIADTLKDQDIEPIHSRVSTAYYEAQKAKLPETELTRSIIFQWKDYLNSRKNSIKALTYSNQRNSIEALEEWLKAEKLEGLRPEQFTLRHLTKWQDYLNKDHSGNTVAKRLKHFKAFLKYYQELGGHSPVKLTQIKYKETEGVKIYLTEEELEAFKDAPVKGINSLKVQRSGKTETVYVNLEHVRDLFVLQCNTGLRISDLKRLDKNIKGNRVAIENKKTGKKVEIPITPAIRAILEKYKYKLPEISEQKINDGIKEIYRICFPKNKIQVREGEGFKTVHTWTLISSHDAIRTFITLSAERGMSVSAISTITGKTIPVLLKHYLSQSQKFAEKEMEKAWGYSPLKIAR